MKYIWFGINVIYKADKECLKYRSQIYNCWHWEWNVWDLFVIALFAYLIMYALLKYWELIKNH